MCVDEKFGVDHDGLQPSTDVFNDHVFAKIFRASRIPSRSVAFDHRTGLPIDLTRGSRGNAEYFGKLPHRLPLLLAFDALARKMLLQEVFAARLVYGFPFRGFGVSGSFEGMGFGG